jgi:hypothetical protein
MKLPNKIDGALVRTAAVIADDIRRAIADQIDPVWVAENVFQAFPDGVTATPVQARVWAQLNLRFDNRPLMLVLQQLYATGWVLGQDAGAAYVADQRLTKATPSTDELMAALNIDWDNWKPGNRAAEQLVRTSPGLQGLLDQAGATIKGMNETTVSRVGTVIADGLRRGASSGSLAKDLVQSGIEGLLADPSRALAIANTEMSRALNVSSMNYYTDSGVEKVEWLALEACELCGQNADAGAIPLGEVFPSGDTEPPGHPNCRCGIRAVFDYEDSPLAPVEVVGDAETVLAEAQALQQQTNVPEIWPWEKGWANSFANQAEANAAYLEQQKIAESTLLSDLKVNIPTQKVPEYLEKSLMNTNPLYDPYKKGYSTNCARVVNAYEMRRRGFDVTATPKPIGILKNDGSQIKNTYLNSWRDPVSGKNGFELADDLPGQWSVEQIKNVLKREHPEGSRGFISQSWNSSPKGAGHVYTWEIENGRVKFYDAQTGASNVDEYIDRGFNFSWLRVDNLEPTANILRYLKGYKK